MLEANRIVRRTTRQVRVDGIPIGGDAPIVVQSMTNTDTTDSAATAEQVIELAEAGSELVRITVNTEQAAAAVEDVRKRLDAAGCTVPLVGDFHYNGHKLLAKFPPCAEILAKYRINPGNVGRGERHDSQFRQMIEIACRYEKPIRITGPESSCTAARRKCCPANPQIARGSHSRCTGGICRTKR